MNGLLRSAGPQVLLAGIFFVSALPRVFAQAEKSQGTGYAGMDACATCHDEITDAFKRSAHWAAMKLKMPSAEAQGCESCHGPGQKHAEDTTQPVFSFKKESAHERSARCLSCHAKRNRTAFRHSVHERNDISCDICHSSGHSLRDVVSLKLLRQTENRLCGSCHGEQRAQMEMPYRHRTSDGVLRCGDCHDAHGKSIRLAGKLAQDQPCFKCHAEKQGPFAFEHLASTITGCGSCHQPHGSTNPKLLIRVEVRFLCLECHPNTPQFHDISKTLYQNCTACHPAIHGSNTDRRFLR